MLARMLRVSAGLELLAAALLAYALMQLGMSAIPAVLLALLLPLAVHAVPLAIEFVTGAIIDRRALDADLAHDPLEGRGESLKRVVALRWHNRVGGLGGVREGRCRGPALRG